MSSRIRAWMFSLVLTIAAAMGLAGMPSPAHAQGSSALSQANLDGATQMQDCTKGCTFSTCQGSICTVWHCDDAHGCIITGSYRNPGNVANAESQMGTPVFKSFDDVAYVKTCSGDRCQLYEVTTTKAAKVGYVENIDQILKELRAKHEAGIG